jgi:hypothetical protein
MKLLLSLAHYHIVYLIIKLIWINPMFLQLENCSIFIGPFTNPFPLLHKFPTSLLLTKYYYKTNALLHAMNSGVCFSPPNLIEISHP